jgi:hypothetical protein
MPMFLVRRKPDHIARPNLFNRPTLMLCQPSPEVTSNV